MMPREVLARLKQIYLQHYDKEKQYQVKTKFQNERCAHLKELIAKIEIKPNLMKSANNRNRLFVNTKTALAFQPSDEIPSGSLSTVYYTPSPRGTA